MREIENLKKTILKEYPRLSEESSFKFDCRRGLPCFNECCGDVNIFLTPYDILRLKNNLGITSGEFLNEYTIFPFDENLKYPVVLLKMKDDEKKNCPFVDSDGCRVYLDRPWSCRMYPLGLASPKEDSADLDREFYFMLEENICKGHKEDREFTVAEWLSDQGIDEYNRLGKEFKEITLHQFFQEGKNLTPEKIDMFFLACYNIDKFREFVFESSFFDKVEVDSETKARIKEDDVEFLLFGYSWLRFALFGEKTLKVKGEVLEAKKKKLENKSKT